MVNHLVGLSGVVWFPIRCADLSRDSPSVRAGMALRAGEGRRRVRGGWPLPWIPVRCGGWQGANRKGRE